MLSAQRGNNSDMTWELEWENIYGTRRYSFAVKSQLLPTLALKVYFEKELAVYYIRIPLHMNHEWLEVINTVVL